MEKIPKEEEERIRRIMQNKYSKKNKSKRWGVFFFFVIFIVLVFAFIFITPKIIPLFNSLFGKDILIKVDANKQNFYLEHGQKENLEFTISLKGSALCQAKCSYDFLDLSSNKSIKEEKFTLSSLAQTKTFELESNRLGKGQEIYRFDLE